MTDETDGFDDPGDHLVRIGQDVVVVADHAVAAREPAVVVS